VVAQVTARRLPAAPLVEAVKRHPMIGWPRRGWRARLRQAAGKRGASAYHRAAREGSVTLRSVEVLCDGLGWHPRELYGDAYDRAALAGRPPDFDPWQGVA
jgi:hypothetical protein